MPLEARCQCRREPHWRTSRHWNAILDPPASRFACPHVTRAGALGLCHALILGWHGKAAACPCCSGNPRDEQVCSAHPQLTRTRARSVIAYRPPPVAAEECKTICELSHAAQEPTLLECITTPKSAGYGQHHLVCHCSYVVPLAILTEFQHCSRAVERPHSHV